MTETFDLYSKYYDLLYEDKNYEQETNFIISEISLINSNARNILDLGCGTGKHAQLLAKNEISVYGVDNSKKMLLQAKENLNPLPKITKDLIFYEHNDIRKFKVNKTFDAVISLFHVMSYQITNTDLHQCILTAYNHLKKDGIFLFDFWYGPAVLSLKPSTKVKKLENNHIKVFRYAEPVNHYNKNVVDVNYSIFVENKLSKEIIRINEKHSMRYFFIPEIEEIIKDKFKIVNSSVWLTKKSPNDKSWSCYVILQKI